MPDERPKRRASDFIRLPSELFEFPQTEDPVLNFLLKQIVDMMDGYVIGNAETNEKLAGIADILRDHTTTLDTQTRQLNELKTAVTVRKFIDFGKAAAPWAAIATVVGVVGSWIWKHLH